VADSLEAQPGADRVIEVTAAINDAPMGALTFEDEVLFDLARLQTVENNLKGRGDRSYRVVTRHRQTGEVGGHPSWPSTRFSRCSAARAIPQWPDRTGAQARPTAQD